MPVHRPSKVFREQLSSLYHGIALWRPSPVEDIYNQVSIGDVGYISSEGSFIRMFNVTIPWDHPLNRRLGEPERYDALPVSEIGAVVRRTLGRVDPCSSSVSREENAGNMQAWSPEQ